MLDQRCEIAVAVGFAVLDHAAKLIGWQANPGHFVGRWRQAPVRRARWRLGAVAGRRIGFGVAAGAGQTGRPFAVHPAHHAHRVGRSGIELQRRIARNVAVLATGALEDLSHRVECFQGLFVIGK
ncbi:hypothetical protein D3C86_1637840 [compost metagenome]